MDRGQRPTANGQRTMDNRPQVPEFDIRRLVEFLISPLGMEEIKEHYNLIEEKDRLGSGVGLLEKERSRQIISRYLPGESIRILDLGGAAGIYAFWLAELGHEVHLCDFTPKHIEQAKKINDGVKAQLVSISIGDARDLRHYEDEYFDCIVLFGPLYHLVERSDRMKALKECKRMLSKNGRLIAAGINRFASLYDGLSRGLIDDPYFVEILKQDLVNGQHRNPNNHPDYFTTTIFQLPEEMEGEFIEAGFSLLNCLPVEGPMWLANNFDQRWKNTDSRKQLLELLNLIEKDKASLLMTHHYIAVAEKF
jgi:ubiquinone/menaquinone biosynthesis C-methylase UbiE